MTDKEFETLKKFIDLEGNEKDLLRDKKNRDLLEDPITHDYIHIKDAVLITYKPYDVNSIFINIEYCKKNYLPILISHTRKEYSPENLVDIRNIKKLDNK